jgi:IS5 family transposase
MLRIHLMQQWFGYSDPAMEEALHDVPLLRGFAGLDAGESRLPDETTILRFRRLLETHDLARSLFNEVVALLADKGLLLRSGTIVDATLIAAAPSTKNRERKRDRDMSQTKKGNQWYFGMKAHIGADADSGLVHTVVGSTAKLGDSKVCDQLLHGEEQIVLGDRGYSSKVRRLDAPREEGQPLYAMPFMRKPGEDLPYDQREANRLLASLRAKVEHPFRVLKRQFGYTKVRYRGLEKNTAQLHTLFACANLWIARRDLIAAG